MLYEKIGNKEVQCNLCAHRCKIKEGNYGICGVRQNKDGKLYTAAYGKAIAANSDPIEKKPLYHFLPGTAAFSMATMGCNFKCSFCQNWRISQVTEDKKSELPGKNLSPEEIVSMAQNRGCDSIAYTYTEPTIFFEYAYDTARLAKEKGIYNVFVTNGFMTKEAIDTIEPYLDAANIDLKSFDDDFYRKICKGRLQPVLDSIKYMKEVGIWIEITTLIVPDQNDSDEELNKIAQFIAGVNKDIPWHISRFHPDYEFTDSKPTPMKTMDKAKKIGKKHGIQQIYLGNIVTDSNTYCHNCGEMVVQRNVFGRSKVNLKNSKCPSCQTKISGVWQ
ncbi:MAG: AmmeMemoRadiSam system radical SAM enzyme [Candidatus Marinimicrobia bacterium]|nr:AmmeMemoRadiSam system radical SAM enzyme [Candidatus Neomarinimicrobiota bacterium]